MSETAQDYRAMHVECTPPHAMHLSVVYLIITGLWQGLARTLLKFFTGVFSK